MLKYFRELRKKMSPDAQEKACTHSEEIRLNRLNNRDEDIQLGLVTSRSGVLVLIDTGAAPPYPKLVRVKSSHDLYKSGRLGPNTFSLARHMEGFR